MVLILVQFPGLYAFVTAIASIEAGAVAGVSTDIYAAYTAGNLTIKGAFPITFRLPEGATSTYMAYDLKVAYKLMENVTGYGRITQGTLDFADIQFTPDIKVGAEYSIGKVALDTALKVTVPAAGADLAWSIPCTLRASW